MYVFLSTTSIAPHSLSLNIKYIEYCDVFYLEYVNISDIKSGHINTCSEAFKRIWRGDLTQNLQMGWNIDTCSRSQAIMCQKKIIKNVTGSTKKLEKGQNHGCLHNLNSVHMCSVCAPWQFQWHQHVLSPSSQCPEEVMTICWITVQCIVFSLCSLQLRHFSCTAKAYRQDFRVLPWWISLWVFCMLVTLVAVWTNEQASQSF